MCAAQARPYREACHYSAFVEAMRAARAAEPNATFYLAADSEEAYAHVAGAFEPGAVVRVQAADAACGGGDADRRAVACQRVALADMLNLAHTRRYELVHLES